VPDRFESKENSQPIPAIGNDCKNAGDRAIQGTVAENFNAVIEPVKRKMRVHELIIGGLPKQSYIETTAAKNKLDNSYH
jgi:hypothetical protein